MIKGIGHVAYLVKDMEQSLKFYCEILGFRQAFAIDDEAGRPWIQYLALPGGQFIELFYHRTNFEENGSYSHLCLEVDDIQKIADHMQQNGIPLDVEPNLGRDGNWQCWVRDPDGNRIEFMQMSPDSPQMKI